jgi:hypothetical protein
VIHPKKLVPGAVLARVRRGKKIVRKVTECGEFSHFGGQTDTDSCRYVIIEHYQGSRVGREGQTTRRTLSAWADDVDAPNP